MASLETLLTEIEAEARRAPFPLDLDTYARWDRDPHSPILHAGNLAAPVCSFGRELGRDEVRLRQPQVGAAGSKVRAGILAAVGEPNADPLDYVLLTNTVPYKPPENRAYSEPVKRRFRPFVERLLVCHWGGDTILALGTEAFQWFAPYAEAGALAAHWEREDRYEAWLSCRLRADDGGTTRERAVRVGPLPHPSPLNARWLPHFPGLLAKRLAEVYR